MKPWIVSLCLLLGLGFLWSGCALTRAGYESAPYRVLKKEGRMEIREYPAMQWVETGRGGDDFMRLFRYISKDNAAEEKIAMTTPVFMTGDATSEQRMAFVLPAQMAQPPQPKQDSVKVRRVEPAIYAVLRFRGGQQGVHGEAARRLQDWMSLQQLPVKGSPLFAYFDPPWTPGFLRRNEVMIPTTQP